MSNKGFFCICSSKFDLNDKEPLALSCGHTICRDCLQKIA